VHEAKGAGMEQTEEEGWYTDPYGLHEARWMSMGKPTKLVRDGQLESYDDPPDSAPSLPAERIEPPPGSVTSADDLRADDAETETPTIAAIDDAERNFVLSGWQGLTRSRRALRRKNDPRFFR
jgi:hypothetical protein